MPSAAPGSRRRLARRLLHPVATITVFAIALDAAQWLRAAPLWVDEEMVALNFRDRSFRDLPGPLWLGQAAPLGWLALQRATVLGFGTSELVLRLVPALSGVGTVVVAAWIGGRWMTPAAGTLFVFICWIGQWMSHYRFELKHYSADAFAALLLPALAAWAAEERDTAAARVRWMRWWLVAALAQWVAYGALLVTPLCALLLMGMILTRHGLRSAVHAASGGILLLLSFAAHYSLSLRFADRSPHLRTYWSVELPPEGSGLGGTTRWILGRLDNLADNPGGTELAVVLWLCALAGFIFSSRHFAGVLFASVPVAAFGLAAMRQVPLADRLALWIVPALYLGVAMAFDTGARQILAGWRHKRLSRMAIGVIPLAASLFVSVGIAVQGYAHLDTGVPGDSNHALDDRRAVAWLMARREPGDAILSTRLGWPAVWWYGPVSLQRPWPGGRLPDGSVMLEAFHEAPRSGCPRDLEAALEGRRRVLVYVGFPDTPDGFYQLLIREFARFGEVVDSGRFSTTGRTAVIRLRDASPLPADGGRGTAATGHGLAGCVGLRVARRW